MSRTIALVGLLISGGQAFTQITWRRTYGGSGSDVATSIKQTADGGYIVSGSTGSYGMGGDVYLVKLDEEGNRAWSSYFGGSNVEESWSVEELSDGGYLLAGLTASAGSGGYDGYLLKVDHLGALEWEQFIGTPDWDFFYDVDVDASGFYLVGKTYASSYGDADVWLVRTDLMGNVIWQRVIGGSGEDEGRSVSSTPDGGCVLAGRRMADNGSADAYVAKYSSAGVLEWDTIVGTDSLDIAFSVIRTNDGGYVVGGTTWGYSAWGEMMLAKIDANGAPLWFSHTGQLADWEGREVMERQGGGFALVGYTEAFGLGGRDVYLLLTNANGDYDFGTTYGGEEDDEGWAMDLTTDGGFIAAGGTTSFGPGPKAMFVVKSGPDGLTESENVDETFDPVGIGEDHRLNLFTISPNPVEPGGRLTVRSSTFDLQRLELRDMQGRLIVTRPFDFPEVSIQMPMLAQGVYQLTVTTKAGSAPGSLLMVR